MMFDPKTEAEIMDGESEPGIRELVGVHHNAIGSIEGLGNLATLQSRGSLSS